MTLGDHLQPLRGLDSSQAPGDVDGGLPLVEGNTSPLEIEQVVGYFAGGSMPLEMHRTTAVERVFLLDADKRLLALRGANFNGFLLDSRDIFLDMLADAGVGSLSGDQQEAMRSANDAYSGLSPFFNLKSALNQLFGKELFLPVHQGREAENVIAQCLISPESVVLSNCRLVVTKAASLINPASVLELVPQSSFDTTFEAPFKGDIDLGLLAQTTESVGVERIAFVRIECGANLLGGQPVSLANLHAVSEFCSKHGLLLVLDASILADNLYFIKTREAAARDKSIRQIALEMADLADIVYFGASKYGSLRGGGILTNNQELYHRMRQFVQLYEGYLAIGGMSVRELQTIALGVAETCDFHVVSQTPVFVAELFRMLSKRGVPCASPPGGLGVYIDARRFLDHLPQEQYPGGSLAAAIYLAGG
ncbi:MAG: tryptophanase, partial [Actinomycetia bacterium]|nr:tryptophanase [Actinomycetes bacterium]